MLPLLLNGSLASFLVKILSVSYLWGRVFYVLRVKLSSLSTMYIDRESFIQNFITELGGRSIHLDHSPMRRNFSFFHLQNCYST